MGVDELIAAVVLGIASVGDETWAIAGATNTMANRHSTALNRDDDDDIDRTSGTDGSK